MDEVALEKVAVWRTGRFWVGVMLVVLGVLVLVDRGVLCAGFLFRYFDQDQALLWYAAREFLHGRFHEPCFYGQDYNSCIESYLAAPLLLCGVPYWVALPVVTVGLGLLPFYLIALVAWRRGQEVLAGVSLLVPVILPVTYGMVTGMPRGFVPGVALGSVVAVWVLGEGKREKQLNMLSGAPAPLSMAHGGSAARGFSWWFGWRYFWMGVLSVVAGMFTANVALLLFPMLIYGVARFWRRMGFWTGMVSGVLVGGIYPMYVYYFYHVWHEDYVTQHRGEVFTWTMRNFEIFWRWWPAAFGDLVPMGVPAKWAATVLLSVAIGVVVILLVRRQWVLVVASVGCAGVTLASCGYSRLFYGTTSVFYPMSRMFLAVPVVMVWVMLAAGPMRGRWKGWVSMVLVGMMVGAGGWAVVVRRGELPGVIAAELEENARVSPLYSMEVEELKRLGSEVEKVADAEHADLVFFGTEQWRKYDYCLPLVTTCETLFTYKERRTWRLYEENHPRHEWILTLDRQVFEMAGQAGYPGKAVESEDGPAIYVIETKGESVVGMAGKMGLSFREFDQSK